MLFDTEMTDQEAELLVDPAPKGRYLVEITGYIRDDNDSDDFTKTFQSGNSGLCVLLMIAEEGLHRGKRVKPYNAPKGTGFMARFKRAFPAASQGKLFDAAASIGMQCLADLKISEYEGDRRNEVMALNPQVKGEQKKSDVPF